MKIIVSGSSGLVGSALVARLKQDGHEVIALVRRPPRQGEIEWDPAAGELDAKSLEGADAVVHLAGDNIAAGRWTQRKKQRIRDSRVDGTRLLSEALAQLDSPPKVLAVASATGFYGDRGEMQLDEESAAGSGFLADVCREWEAASEAAEQKGVRVLHLRFGAVLSKQGGALGKMLPAFKMGVAGHIGNGHQYMSWIDIDDLVGAISFLLGRDDISGNINLVSPHPVSNSEFTHTLGHVLHRPAFLPLPAIAARLAFGEMAEHVLLASAKVKPSRLLAVGYQFQYPDLEQSLNHQLKS